MSRNEFLLLDIPARTGERIQDVAFPPVLDFLGVKVTGRPARVFDMRRNKEVPFPFRKPVRDFAFRSPSEHMPTSDLAVALGEHSTHVQRVDLELGIGLIPLFMPRASAVAYSHDGRYLAAGSTDGLVRIWDITGDTTGQPTKVWETSPGGLRKLKMVKQPCYMDCEPKEIRYTRAGKNAVVGLAFSSRHDLLFILMSDGRCLMERLREPGREPEPYLRDADDNDSPFDWDCYCMSTHREIPVIALGGCGPSVYLANLDKGEIVTVATGISPVVRHLGFTTDGHLLVLGSSSAELWGFDPLRRIGSAGADEGKMFLSAREYDGSIFLAQAPVDVQASV